MSNKRKYIGVMNQWLEPGFIARDLTDGKYRVRCADGLTYGNCWSAFESDNLRDIIRKLTEFDFTIHKFNSPSMLFAWLSLKSEPFSK